MEAATSFILPGYVTSYLHRVREYYLLPAQIRKDDLCTRIQIRLCGDNLHLGRIL